MTSGTDRSLLLADTDVESRAAVTSFASTLGVVVNAVDAGAEALAAADRELPALVLLAVDLVDPSAYEVLRQMRERSGDRLPIAFLSAPASEPRDEIAALLLGADDYFTKPLQADRFTARIRRLLTHSPLRSPPVPPAGVSAVQSSLTKREQQVLALLVEGRRSAEIADSLCITRKTASTHVEHILSKLGAHSQAQAVAFAIRYQIVGIPE